MCTCVCVCLPDSYSGKYREFFHFAVRVVSSESAESELGGSEERVESFSWRLGLQVHSRGFPSSRSETTIEVLLQDPDHHHQDETHYRKDGRKQAVVVDRGLYRVVGLGGETVGGFGGVAPDCCIGIDTIGRARLVTLGTVDRCGGVSGRRGLFGSRGKGCKVFVRRLIGCQRGY